MDNYSFNCITPEVRRLATFTHTPLPNQRKIAVSNSPAKLAKAGFMRHENAMEDEVSCEDCGIRYGGWSGESPFAVHRVLSEKCPFLNTPSSAHTIQQHPRVVEARRCLFPENDAGSNDDGIDGVNDDASDADGGNERSDTEESDNSNDDSRSGTENEVPESSARPQQEEPAFVSVLSDQANFTFPFKPLIGDYAVLFASRRLKTFTDQSCPECVEWAEEGFVFRSDTRDVQCVFCALVLPFHTCDPCQSHAAKSVCCPHVLMVDVGNIPAAVEEQIRTKNLLRQLRNRSPLRSYAIAFPQFEEEAVRLGTFDNWPYSSWDCHAPLQASAMSEAGLYYTGMFYIWSVFI